MDRINSVGEKELRAEESRNDAPFRKPRCVFVECSEDIRPSRPADAPRD